MNADLPDGWERTTLKEIGKWSTGGTPSRSNPKFFGRGVSWVKSGDLKDGPIQRTDEEITKFGLDNSSAKLMPAGTISMALYGATIGKLGLMTFPAATNQACANVIPNPEKVETKYLFFYLLSERRNFIGQGQGGAQPNISQGIVREHPMPLAPLAEQRRIVAKLEKLLEKVEACQKRLDKIPTLLKRFRQSVLSAACSGRLTEDWRLEKKSKIEISWEQTTLGDVGTLYCGQSPSRQFVNRVGNGTPYVTGPEQWSGFEIEMNKWTTNPKRHVPPDCVFITVKGAGVGTVFPGVSCAIGRDIYAYKPSLTCHSAYIFFVLQSTVDKIKAMAQGDIPGLTREQIMGHPISVPTLDEQKEIVSRVANLFSLADKIELRYSTGITHIDKLTQSILAKAFRGELVPREPTQKGVKRKR